MIKITVVVFALWFIYKKLSNHNDLKNFLNMLQAMPGVLVYTFLSIVFLLMLLNWFLEAIKWQKLIRNVEQISLWKAVESVFCGLTWAVFTPNRIGEYGGRVFFLSPRRRIIGVVAMSVGNIGQLVLTNVFGAIATMIFVKRFTEIDPILFLALCALAAVFSIFFIVFYFNIKWLNNLLMSIRFTRKYNRFYKVLARYRKRDLAKILLLCLARYTVFTSQYLILFIWLLPSIHSYDILMLVPILFFVQSSLPSLDLLDIGVRNVTGLFFFKHVTNESTAVIAVISSIWLINIIIPAILGAFFVSQTTIFGTTKKPVINHDK